MNADQVICCLTGISFRCAAGTRTPMGPCNIRALLCEHGCSVRYHLDKLHPGLANFAIACLAMVIILLITRFLYKRQIFLRV